MYLLLINVNGKRKFLLRCCYFEARRTAMKLAKVKTVSEINLVEVSHIEKYGGI